MEKIKILIVDDSLIYRKLLERALLSIDKVHVLGSVWNGKKALEFIKNDSIPQLITLDVEMPEMDGLATLKEIKKVNAMLPKNKKISVLMISSLTQAGAEVTLQALEEGAFDFILKPQNTNALANYQELQRALVEKISAFSGSLVSAIPFVNAHHTTTSPHHSTTNISTKKAINYKIVDAIVIGISTGGPKAMLEMLPELCNVTDLPILIVQHMPKEFTKSFADNLNRKCTHDVVEAGEGMRINYKTIYIAPGGRHMYLRRNELREPLIALNDNPPENNCRPSVDVLFRSAADVYAGRLIALIMTGMGNDGSKSMMALKRAGAVIVAQDQESSVVWGMPENAIQTGCVDYVLALNQIPETIRQIITKKS